MLLCNLNFQVQLPEMALPPPKDMHFLNLEINFLHHTPAMQLGAAAKRPIVCLRWMWFVSMSSVLSPDSSACSFLTLWQWKPSFCENWNNTRRIVREFIAILLCDVVLVQVSKLISIIRPHQKSRVLFAHSTNVRITKKRFGWSRQVIEEIRFGAKSPVFVCIFRV